MNAIIIESYIIRNWAEIADEDGYLRAAEACGDEAEAAACRANIAALEAEIAALEAEKRAVLAAA